MSGISTQSDTAAGGATSIGRALQILGDRWTLIVLRNAFMLRTRRFDEWRRQTGISESVLAGRLRDLVEAGVLERVAYAPRRHEYRLTSRGLGLWALLVAIWEWEKRWAAGAAELQPDLHHLDCGASITPRLICGYCRQPVSVRDVRTRVAGPASLRVDAPRRSRRRSTRGQEPSAAELLVPETVAIIGDRWSTFVLGAAFLGRRRFSEFERDLGISPTLLSDRLRRFSELGVLEQAAASNLARPVYRLSEKGRAIFPVFALLIQWGDRWFPSPAGPPIAMEHVGCGRRFVPRLGCDACGRTLQRRRVRFGSGSATRGADTGGANDD